MKISWIGLIGTIFIIFLIMFGLLGFMALNKEYNNYKTFEDKISMDNTPQENLKICNEYTTYLMEDCIDVISEYHKLGELGK